jgi:hypothetical protein
MQLLHDIPAMTKQTTAWCLSHTHLDGTRASLKEDCVYDECALTTNERAGWGYYSSPMCHRWCIVSEEDGMEFKKTCDRYMACYVSTMRGNPKVTSDRGSSLIPKIQAVCNTAWEEELERPHKKRKINEVSKTVSHIVEGDDISDCCRFCGDVSKHSTLEESRCCWRKYVTVCPKCKPRYENRFGQGICFACGVHCCGCGQVVPRPERRNWEVAYEFIDRCEHCTPKLVDALHDCKPGVSLPLDIAKLIVHEYVKLF